MTEKRRQVTCEYRGNPTIKWIVYRAQRRDEVRLRCVAELIGLGPDVDREVVGNLGVANAESIVAGHSALRRTRGRQESESVRGKTDDRNEHDEKCTA